MSLFDSCSGTQEDVMIVIAYSLRGSTRMTQCAKAISSPRVESTARDTDNLQNVQAHSVAGQA